MSASINRNKQTNELQKLEKIGAFKNLPKVCVDTIFMAKHKKFLQSFLEYDKISLKLGDRKEEYIFKDQLKQTNKFIKS